MRRRVRQAVLSSTSVLALATLISAPAWAAPPLPTGGAVQSGAAAIAAAGANALQITQSSQRAVISWQSFDIGAANAVKFVQPGASSATLNRVLSDTSSTIAGQLSANGAVYLVNPNGISITSTGAVAAGGGFVASTLDIADTDFMAGKTAFAGSGAAGVSNAGTIIVGAGGYVALLGGFVANDGVIEAPLGRVALGSGQAATLDLSGDGFLQVALPATATAADGSAISVSGSVTAAGGRIQIAAATARESARNVVNIPGSLNATRLSGAGGVISLDAGEGGVLNLGGQIEAKGGAGSAGGSVALAGDVIANAAAVDVSGGTGGSVSETARVIGDYGTITALGVSGAGGAVSATASQAYLETATSTIDASGEAGGAIAIVSAGSLFTSGEMSANGERGGGGTVALRGQKTDLIDSHLSANGASGGGLVQVGGAIGAAYDSAAQQLTVSPTSAISADALTSGGGGHVSLWSTGQSAVSGQLSAKGGAQGGNGGLVEASSAGQLGFNASADVTAPAGTAGLVKLDPKFIVIEDQPPQGLGYNLLDPLPATGNTFGASVLQATAGSNLVVISDPTNSAIASKAGAIYVFDIKTGAAISALTGSHANDLYGANVAVDQNGAAALVEAPTWNGNRGAITRFSISGGPNGVVSSANSLIGSTAGDQVGTEVVAMTGAIAGSLLIGSPNWTNPATGAVKAGAVTYAIGAAPLTGVVSASNSLVGSTAGDQVGLGISYPGFSLITGVNYPTSTYYLTGTAYNYDNINTGPNLTVLQPNPSNNGMNDNFYLNQNFPTAPNNFFVSTPNWSNGSGVSKAGAVTFFTLDQPLTGTLGASNSLVGSHVGDGVGSGGITPSIKGDYALISSPNWSNGTAANVGAVTWASGSSPTVGVVGPSNSLVGGTAGDTLGAQPAHVAASSYPNAEIIFLPNDNYVVFDHTWTNPTTGAANAGSVTWGAAAGGVKGVVTAANSLVGSSANDDVANVLALPNGNYVVASPAWTNTATGASFAGEVTWGSGTTGVSGVVSAANSIVGTHTYDYVGGIGPNTNTPYGSTTNYINYPISVFDLTQQGVVTTPHISSNFVIVSYTWNSQTGAVTWVNGDTGKTIDGSNVISPINSLIGTQTGDFIGRRNVTVPLAFLPSSNFIYNDGGASSLGFVGFQILDNSNYVLESDFWNGNRGAVTFGNANTGVAGVVGAGNSVVGSTSGDQVGASFNPQTGYASSGIAAFANGHDYLILSSDWTNPATGAANAGAITFVNGATGLPIGGNGPISAANSLIGTQANDRVGMLAPAALGQKLLVADPLWNNAAASSAGAVTVFDPANPALTLGPITVANSLVGTTANDQVGSGQVGLPNYASGKTLYAISSPNWTNPTTGAAKAGAVTFFYGDSTPEPVGPITTVNSIIGSNAGDQVGSIPTDTTGYTGVGWAVPLAKSGGANADGSAGDDPNFGNFLLLTPGWNGGRGAVTTIIANGDSWNTVGGNHVIGAANSLIGDTPDVNGAGGDHIGRLSSVVTIEDLFAVLSPQWHGGTGAVTWGNALTGTVGAVSAANSLVGAQAGDMVGSGGLAINYYASGTPYSNGVVLSPLWANGATPKAGAATFVNRGAPPVGVVSQANSLVGDQANEQVGSGGLISHYGSFLISTPSYAQNDVVVGAVTVIDPATGNLLDLRNLVSTGNSVIGVMANTASLTLAGTSYSGGQDTNKYYADGVSTFGNDYTAGVFYINPTQLASLPTDARNILTGAGGQVTVALTTPPQVETVPYNLSSGDTLYIPPGVIASLLQSGDNVLLQASSDISVLSPLTVNRITGASLTLSAGRSILLSAPITTDSGPLTLTANDTAADGVVDAFRDPGAGQITMGAGDTINAGTAAVSMTLQTGAGLTNGAGGAITLNSITAGTISAANLATGAGAGQIAISPGATLSASGAGNAIVLAGSQFANRSGADALSEGLGGRFLIYSNDWAADTRGGLIGDDLYNRNYAANPPSSLGGSRSLFIYSRQPILTVAGNDASRAYGNPNPPFTASITGLVNGDAAAYAYSGAPNITTPAATSSNVGIYPIIPTLGSLASSAGYGFAFVNGALTVVPRGVVIGINVAADNLSKTYGNPDPTLTYTVTSGSLAPGDQFNGSLARDPGENVGGYAIRQGSLTLNANYALSFTNGLLTITAATLTYTANPFTRSYGDPNPALTGTVTGFKFNDTPGSATTGTASFTTTATASSPVGRYAETGSGLAANNGNYVFVQAASNATALSVNPAPLTYVANPVSRVYGDANPAFSGTVTGLKLSDTLAGVTSGTASFASAATAASGVGQYGINGSGLTLLNGNYTIGSAAANATALTITPAMLTYVANPASRPYGQANPLFTGTVAGLKAGDTLAGATTGTLLFSASATSLSPMGPYAINGSGLTAANYLFQQAVGNATALTVTAAVAHPRSVRQTLRPLAYVPVDLDAVGVGPDGSVSVNPLRLDLPPSFSPTGGDTEGTR